MTPADSTALIANGHYGAGDNEMTTAAPSHWCKSTRSSTQTNCVEVGRTAKGAAVRDAKDREAGHFTAAPVYGAPCGLCRVHPMG